MARKNPSPGKARAVARTQPERGAPRRTSTPLSRSAREAPKRPVTPLDALELATRKWLAGERLDIGRLAQELGIGRATLFRWVGTREQLYGEVVREQYARQRRYLLKTARGKGLDLLENVAKRNLEILATSAPMRRFIESDPEFAIRLLTSPQGVVQQYSISAEVELLRRVVAEEKINPQLDLHSLALIIIRIGEAFLYSGTMNGEKPDLDTFVAAIRILTSAQKKTSSKRKRSPRA